MKYIFEQVYSISDNMFAGAEQGMPIMYGDQSRYIESLNCHASMHCQHKVQHNMLV